MPWTTVVPVVAAAGPRRDLGLATPAGARRAGGRVPRRGRAGRGAPRRGRRAPGRRAVRLARARGRGDRDRGRADRHADGVGRRGHRLARPRHGVRRGDDHVQRDRRPLPAARRASPPGRGVQRGGHRHRAGHGVHARDAQPRAPDLHDEQSGRRVLPAAARVRRRGLARALRPVRAHPDRPPPRLLPARPTGGAARPTSTPTRRPTGWPCRASACCSSPSSRRRAREDRVAGRSRTAWTPSAPRSRRSA